MKKLFALLISLAMCLSFGACGGTSDVDENAGDDVVNVDPQIPDGDEVETPAESDGQDETQEPSDEGEGTQPDDPDTSTEEPDNTHAEEPDTPVVSDEPEFDTSWASNEYEAMLPTPPIGPWEKTGSPEDLHIIATPLDAIDYSVGSRDRTALANYFAGLEAIGFTVNEVGYSSEALLGTKLPDHWVIIDTQGRYAQLSIYCNAERKDELVGYSIITFDLTTFGTEGGDIDEPYDPDTPSSPQWTVEDFEGFLPPLPFTGWTGGMTGENTYKISVTGLNTSAATNPPDSGEPDGKDKDTFLDYLATLPSHGFTVTETGSGYMWEVDDGHGNVATFKIGDGGLFLTIVKGQDVTVQQPSGGNGSSSQGGTLDISLPELPYGDWEREDLSDRMFLLRGENVDEWEMCEVFIADLSLDGYTVHEIVYEPEGYYEYQAEKNVGSARYVINIQGDAGADSAVISVTVK